MGQVIHLDQRGKEHLLGSHRRETIERLLDHLPDYEPAPAQGGAASGDGGTPGMPPIYFDRSVQELLRTLDRLREMETVEPPSGGARGATVHAHLQSFYRSEFRTVRPRPTKRIVRGKVTWAEAAPAMWRRERIVSPWIIMPLVDAGVVFVVAGFRGEPFLPEELLAA